MSKLVFDTLNNIRQLDSGKVIASCNTNQNARFLSASANACAGLDVERVEQLTILPLFLEAQRLRELVSRLQFENREQANAIVEYEKALRSTQCEKSLHPTEYNLPSVEGF